jgi:hypothetical protein
MYCIASLLQPANLNFNFGTSHQQLMLTVWREIKPIDCVRINNNFKMVADPYVTVFASIFFTLK